MNDILYAFNDEWPLEATRSTSGIDAHERLRINYCSETPKGFRLLLLKAKNVMLGRRWHDDEIVNCAHAAYHKFYWLPRCRMRKHRRFCTCRSWHMQQYIARHTCRYRSRSEIDAFIRSSQMENVD